MKFGDKTENKMEKIKTRNNDTLEFITIDSYTGEGTDDVTIVIHNKLCKDSSHINLDYQEATQLRDLLNDWICD